MCLTAIEILFLIAGVWLLITGKIPNKFFQLLFGKGDYQLSPLHSRLFGLLLASPLPFILVVSFLINLFFPNANYVVIATSFEIIYDIVVAIIAILIARKSRRAPLQENPIPTRADDNTPQ